MSEPPQPSRPNTLIKQINRGKKRKINHDQWKQVKAKMLRNSGMPYSTSKGFEKPAKKPPTPHDLCSVGCTYEGCTVLRESIAQRIFLFNMFYDLKYNEQQQFLAGCMDLHAPKRRRIPEAMSSRMCTVMYVLPTQNRTEKLQVCQKQIMNTFDVTKRRLQVLREKLKLGKDVFDERGLHGNRPRSISDSEKQIAVDHIKSIPCQESHYARHSSKALYLDPNLNVTKMYKLFKAKHPGSRIEIHTYREYFRESNRKFGLPRSDTCKTCDRYFVQIMAADSEEKERKLREESEIHHRKAEKAYSTLSSDVEAAKMCDSLVVLCVDLQQVIFTPNLQHSDVYYQRQFSNYNFCIHNMGKNEATMCVWNESTGKRGAAEIVSCILQYIFNNFQKLMPHESRTLILWSDRCIGQNNNWKMISLCHYLVALGYFSEVNQKFLTTGHSFLPCDRDFALIERKKKVETLHIPDDVINMIRNSKEENPFMVQAMEGCFVDFSPVEEQINRHPGLKISECRWIQFRGDSLTEVRTRKSHNTLEMWKVYEIIKKKGRGRSSSNVNTRYKKIEQSEFMCLYTEGKLPISSAKKNDLVKMAEYLPPGPKQLFYQSLPSVD